MLAGGQSQRWSQWERQVAPRLPDIVTVLWLMAQQTEGNDGKWVFNVLHLNRSQLTVLAGTSLHNSSL